MKSHIETEPSTYEGAEVSDPISWYFGQIGQFKVIKETEEQHQLARRIFRGQLALRALEAVQRSELLTPPQTECIRELLEDNAARFLLDNYPTPPKKPGEQANEMRPFLSVADRYIRWVDSKLTQASHQEVIMTQVKFASQGLGSFKEMVEGNLRLVVSVTKECYALNIPLLDKVSYGNEALMKAVARFDFRMGNRFSTFAERGIRWAVWQGIEESDWYPKRQSGDDGFGREMEQISALKTPSYLSTLVRTGEGFQELGDLIPSEEPDPLEAVIARVDPRVRVEELLQCLTPRELKLVRQHFGLDGGKGITLEEIGRNEGSFLTRSRMSQILIKALRKMQDAAESGLPRVDRPDNHRSRGFTLTSQQARVLQYAADGLSNQEIAAILNNSTRTIKVHMRAIYQAAADFDGIPKTKFKRVAELATQAGFIQLPEGWEITTRANAKKNHTPATTRTA